MHLFKKSQMDKMNQELKKYTTQTYKQIKYVPIFIQSDHICI